ncbi:DUF2271 domain-containing protein [Rheinheimera sp. F8]|uniref:DUF2271 domain-containing protein n=1 Tax=Rheinheimera sp. F8 TaxID=1763998 RepID=UPI000744C7B0|nr:DUF2271 domain-containing protein [Rheinheimera sp. F8]ALZ74615.1 hypothetical protein ATY27_01800 [Rheinheimera sp. F8]
MKKISVALVLLSGLVLPATASDLEIALQLPKISEGQYHRPYVAVWVEDSSENSVRLIEIWREKPDWIKDLRRFWRKTGRADQPLVDARTGATKGPGQYRLRWDGKDDKGAAVPNGEYQLVIEAAREHGGRQLVKQKFNWDGSAVALSVAAGNEIGQVQLNRKAP